MLNINDVVQSVSKFNGFKEELIGALTSSPEVQKYSSLFSKGGLLVERTIRLEMYVANLIPNVSSEESRRRMWGAALLFVTFVTLFCAVAGLFRNCCILVFIVIVEVLHPVPTTYIFFFFLQFLKYGSMPKGNGGATDYSSLANSAQQMGKATLYGEHAELLANTLNSDVAWKTEPLPSSPIRRKYKKKDDIMRYVQLVGEFPLLSEALLIITLFVLSGFVNGHVVMFVNRHSWKSLFFQFQTSPNTVYLHFFSLLHYKCSLLWSRRSSLRNRWRFTST